MSKNRNVRAVLQWVGENKVSIHPVKIINEEDRFVNARTTIKAGNKSYKAIVRLISDDDKALNECEEQVADEIEQMLKKMKEEEENDKKGRARRRKKVEDPANASTRALASVFGEKPKPTPEQALKLKECTQVKKGLKSAQVAARNEVDTGVVRRSLFKDDIIIDNSEEEGDSGSDEDPLAELSEDKSNQQIEEQKQDDAEVDFLDQEFGGNVTDGAGSATCCSHCRELSRAAKGSALQFVKTLQSFALGAEGSTEQSKVQYIEVLPVQPDQTKTELTKGSGVYIAASDKNYLKSVGDPARTVRLALLMLYGRETLETENVTAKGNRSGAKGMRPEVLKALLLFVNRNKADEYDAIKEADFYRIINRKRYQVGRLRSPASQSSMPPPPKKQKRQDAPRKGKVPMKVKGVIHEKKSVAVDASPVKQSLELPLPPKPLTPACQDSTPAKKNNETPTRKIQSPTRKIEIPASKVQTSAGKVETPKKTQLECDKIVSPKAKALPPKATSPWKVTAAAATPVPAYHAPPGWPQQNYPQASYPYAGHHWEQSNHQDYSRYNPSCAPVPPYPHHYANHGYYQQPFNTPQYAAPASVPPNTESGNQDNANPKSFFGSDDLDNLFAL